MSDDIEDDAEEDDGTDEGTDEGDVPVHEKPDTTNEIEGGIRVTKTANVDAIAAAGGDVSFTFEVRNTANAQLEITALSDDVFGTLSGDADCQVGTALASGASCSFTLSEHLSGTAGTHHVNVVTATGEVSGQVVTDVDSETVLFVSGQVGTTGGIRVTKTANVDAIAAAGGDVSFTFEVRNTANAQLEITALSDDVFGTLSGDADCQVGTALASGASCSFTLSEHLSGTAGTHHVNVVTATGEVSGQVVTDVDSETVLFVSGQVGTTGGIRVTKTANVDAIAAAGGDVSFTFEVRNTANAQLEITALSDDVFGTLSGDADCQVGTALASGASCSFTLSEHLSGTAGTHHVNVVTATGEVSGQVVTDVDSETVLFVSGQVGTTGGIRVTKTANVDAIAAAGGDVSFTFEVRNTANAQLEITALSDDVFGTLSGDADCQVGTALASGASCSFTLSEHLSGTAGTHHVNVVTATGEVGGQVVTDVDSETVLFVSGQIGGGGGSGGNGGQGDAGNDTNVLGASVTRTAAPGAAQGALAFTGQSVLILGALATALLLIGLTVLAIGRKRGRAQL